MDRTCKVWIVDEKVHFSKPLPLYCEDSFFDSTDFIIIINCTPLIENWKGRLKIHFKRVFYCALTSEIHLLMPFDFISGDPDSPFLKYKHSKTIELFHQISSNMYKKKDGSDELVQYSIFTNGVCADIITDVEPMISWMD